MVAEYFLDTEFGRPLIFGNEKNEIEKKTILVFFTVSLLFNKFPISRLC